MEQDVSRAIKQLESIAIKAMKSGYLDDAAKVMHIAEEIERVDQKAMDGSETEYSEAAAHEPADEPNGELTERPNEEAQNVVPLNRFRMKRSASQE
ncbi:MAG: hypothetical protein JST89_01020 [Cyanobacteria bacterium SZAS-4]|nr:hypothetical protein [Cyanobacteria bacterium SZAS-4]